MDKGYKQKLDHLVYATPDLASTVEMLTSLLGVIPVSGGKHSQLGTENFLVGLGAGQYLEIIGPDPSAQAPSIPRPFGIDTLTGPKLVTWAISESDLSAAMAKARERSYDPGIVVPLSRETPDGSTIDWRLVIPPPTERGFTLPGDGLVPFIIDWGSAPHPSQNLGSECQLLELRVTHPKFADISAMLTALDISMPVTFETLPSLTAVINTPSGKVELR